LAIGSRSQLDSLPTRASKRGVHASRCCCIATTLNHSKFIGNYLGQEFLQLKSSDFILDGSAFFLQVDGVPSNAPSLPYLSTLELSGLELKDFPAAVAIALKRLTSLNLYGNSFEKLPAAISHITTLQSFNLSFNAPLQLEEGDLITLAALPHLQNLLIFKQGSTEHDALYSEFSQKSMWVSMAISRRFPLLNLLRDL
jgi:Leucine-rich repeat (LRR) protein